MTLDCASDVGRKTGVVDPEVNATTLLGLIIKRANEFSEINAAAEHE